MGIRQLPDYIKKTPQYFLQGTNQVKERSLAIKDRLSSYLSSIWPSATTHDVFRPTYERYIQPLDLTDGVIFGTCAAVACVVMFTALAILGKPFLAMSAIGAFSILCLSGYMTNRRIHIKFNDEVIVVYAEMLAILNQGNENSLLANETTNIQTKRNKLCYKKFKHLDKEFKTLDAYIERYKKVLSPPQSDESHQIIKNGFCTFLEGARARLIG